MSAKQGARSGAKKLRVVFDTNVLISALVFSGGHLNWLRAHWKAEIVQPLISTSTASEFNRVLQYPKFNLDEELRMDLMAEYLNYCEIVEVTMRFEIECRDVKDQKYLNLAFAGKADVLVSGDEDLLVLEGLCPFRIESPAEYRKRFD